MKFVAIQFMHCIQLQQVYVFNFGEEVVSNTFAKRRGILLVIRQFDDLKIGQSSG